MIRGSSSHHPIDLCDSDEEINIVERTISRARPVRPVKPLPSRINRFPSATRGPPIVRNDVVDLSRSDESDVAGGSRARKGEVMARGNSGTSITTIKRTPTATPSRKTVTPSSNTATPSRKGKEVEKWIRGVHSRSNEVVGKRGRQGVANEVPVVFVESSEEETETIENLPPSRAASQKLPPSRAASSGLGNKRKRQEAANNEVGVMDSQEKSLASPEEEAEAVEKLPPCRAPTNLPPSRAASLGVGSQCKQKQASINEDDESVTKVKGVRGPEEADEPEENLPPSLPPSQQSRPHDEDDLLAEFGNFQFDPMSPTQSLKSLHGDVPRTPSRHSQADPTTPRPKFTPGRNTASGSRHVATPASNHFTPSKKTPTAKPTWDVVSPARLKQAVGAAKPSLADRILEEANRDAEAQRKILLEKEARLKRMTELFSDDGGEAADDVTLQRISRQLDFDLAKARGDVDEESQAGSVGSRRSSRLRSDSIKSHNRKSVPPTASTSKINVPPSAPAPKRDEAHRFFAEQRKKTKRGLKIGDAEDLLQSIRESKSPTKPDHPYPTPESDKFGAAENSGDEGDVEMEDDDAQFPDIDLDLLGNSELGGVLDVARELQESRRGSTRHKADNQALEWDGFWAEDAPTGSTMPVGDSVTSAPSAVGTKTSGSNFIYHGLSARALGSLSAAGAYALRLWKSEVSIRDQILASVSEPESVKRQLMMDNAIHRLKTSPTGKDVKVIDACASIWLAYGARSELSPGCNITSLESLAASKADACEFTCRILEAIISTIPVFVHHLDHLIWPLLLLVVDSTTSDESKALIKSILHEVWAAWLDDETAPELASDLCKQLESLPTSVKVQILLSVGQATESAGIVSRYLAIEWLSPGCLHRSITNDREEEPTLPTLISGGERLLTIVQDPNSSVEDINAFTTFLYQALSDIDSLVQRESETTGVSDDDHLIRDLRALVVKIGHKLRLTGDDTQRIAISQTKGRLSQLAIVLEMQYETTFKRLKKARMENNIGKGLKVGQDGQAKLSFSKQE